MGRRRGSDPALLWFWGRLVAAAQIEPLAWETPYAAGAAKKWQKEKKKKKKKKMECLIESGHEACTHCHTPQVLHNHLQTISKY